MCWQTLVPAYDGSHTATIVMIGKCLRGPFTRLSDEPGPVIQVACTKCEWKAAFSRTELLALYGAEYPLPTLLDHLAMPGYEPVGTLALAFKAPRGDRPQFFQV
jgi:hypothetical protein